MTNEGINFEASIEPRIEAMKQMTNLLNSRGYNGYGWTERCNATVYKTFLRPMIEYGLALRPYAKATLDRIEKAQAWAVRKGLSVARSTSTLACLGALAIDTMEFRNLKLNARFMVNLHQSVDGRVPAVRVYWGLKQAANSNNKSLPWLFRKKNPIHGSLPLRNGLLIQPTRDINRQQQLKARIQLVDTDVPVETYRKETRLKLYREQENKVAAFAVCTDANIQKYDVAALLQKRKFPNKLRRRRLLMWMVGRVCFHQPCANCEAPLTRKHGLRCSGAEEYLREEFPEESELCDEEDPRCLLDVILYKLNFDTKIKDAERIEQAHTCLEAIDSILHLCANRPNPEELFETDDMDDQLRTEIQRHLTDTRRIPHRPPVSKRRPEAHIPPRPRRPLGRPPKRPRLTHEPG